MERNSFKEYSVLAMVSKEEQRPIKACYNFFHLDRGCPKSRIAGKPESRNAGMPECRNAGMPEIKTRKS